MGAQFIVVRFFHEIATIVWIGGMIFQAIALTPVLKKLGNEAQLKIRNGVIKIFGKVGIICIILITLTGILMSVGKINSDLSILSSYGAVLIIKHVITVILIVLAMLNAFTIMPKIQKLAMSGKEIEAKKTKKKMMIISIINPILGIIIILLSSILTFLAV